MHVSGYKYLALSTRAARSSCKKYYVFATSGRCGPVKHFPLFRKKKIKKIKNIFRLLSSPAVDISIAINL